MAGGSILAGQLPLSWSLSNDSISLLSSLGAGLLVSTALAVIIPEGVASVFKADTSFIHYIGFALLSGFLFMFLFVFFCNGILDWSMFDLINCTL
jgi:zinc transporter 9